MTWLRLALANLGLSPLTSAVNVMLMGLGTASIVLLLLAGSQLSETLSRDARGIDLVLGAQGSPTQLVLAAVYHADVPPGNVLQREVERWAEDSRVETAIPLALGDSARGFRIVGTTQAYAALYAADLAAGRFWDRPLEAVLGAAAAESTALEVESRFAGVHGLADAGGTHESRPYRVVGVLAPTGTVLDRLILTSLESVWTLHGDDDHAVEQDAHASGDEADQHEHDEDHDADHGSLDVDREITALLIRYRSPLAAMTLPREVNAGGSLQAASPAVEISRILQLVGVGFDGLRAFSWVLILTAALSVFAALYGSLRARQSDLAMLRCLGATRWELLLALILEGMLLSAFGVVLGFLAGHGSMELLAGWLESERGVARKRARGGADRLDVDAGRDAPPARPVCGGCLGGGAARRAGVPHGCCGNLGGGMMASRFQPSVMRRWVRVVLCAIAALAYALVHGAEETAPSYDLTPDEIAAEPPQDWSDPLPETANAPVAAAEATDVRIEVLAETGYLDEQGRYVIDVLERDYVQLGVLLETGAGRPIQGAAPVFSIKGTSRLLEPGEVALQTVTDETGVVDFALIAGETNLDRDRVRIAFGAASAEILVNVISLRAAGFPMPPAVEGGVPWEELMRARIRYKETKLIADFPPEIEDLAGRTVKLWGFMMPLEPDLWQGRFLLASNPPSCFFHVPGGPAGTVEVFAPDGIEVSWDPVVLEGRFEPQQASETGVVYQLHDARLVAP